MLKYSDYQGASYSGSTKVSKTFSEGSIPSAPAILCHSFINTKEAPQYISRLLSHQNASWAVPIPFVYGQ